MRKSLLVLAAAMVVLAAVPAGAQPLGDEERAAGFVSMFNGTDFSGWRFSESSALPEALPANWKVEDGVIKLAGGGNPHLGSQWDYEDFEMRFQWRALRDKYNSGYFIRSSRKVGSNQINLASGGEGRFFGGKMNGGKPVPELQKPAGEWNEWRTLVEGDKVTFWCNGRLAWEGTEFATPRGYIGLQAEGAPLEFRALRIREIGFAPLDEAKQDYGDYVLRLEWQAETGGEASIALRKGHAAAVRIGETAEGSGGVPAAGLRPAAKLDNPLGQWNYREIRQAGGKVSVWLNGTTVVNEAELKTDPPLPSSGGIGLPAQAKGIRVANARVKKL
jgi:hypothetical protein